MQRAAAQSRIDTNRFEMGSKNNPITAAAEAIRDLRADDSRGVEAAPAASTRAGQQRAMRCPIRMNRGEFRIWISPEETRLTTDFFSHLNFEPVQKQKFDESFYNSLTACLSSLPYQRAYGFRSWFRGRRHQAKSMRLKANTGLMREGAAFCAAAALLALALCVTGFDRAPHLHRSAHLAEPRAGFPAAAGIANSGSAGRSEVRNYFLDLDGDHSLDVATIIEQVSSGYAKYTVRLHLASGAEQSVEVTAPPGGLQVEMADMTGDKIPNDVVLRPALARWLPTVLVNDGHEHFEVVVSGTDPKALLSNEDLGSRKQESQSFVALISSGFKTVHLTNRGRIFDPQIQQRRCSSLSQALPDRMDRASRSGRAPPLSTSI
jgi:hypothetical protein